MISTSFVLHERIAQEEAARAGVGGRRGLYLQAKHVKRPLTTAGKLNFKN
jgi:hypothetical protein